MPVKEPSAATPALSVVAFNYIVMRIWAIIACKGPNLSTLAFRSKGASSVDAGARALWYQQACSKHPTIHSRMCVRAPWPWLLVPPRLRGPPWRGSVA